MEKISSIFKTNNNPHYHNDKQRNNKKKQDNKFSDYFKKEVERIKDGKFI